MLTSRPAGKLRVNIVESIKKSSLIVYSGGRNNTNVWRSSMVDRDQGSENSSPTYQPGKIG